MALRTLMLDKELRDSKFLLAELREDEKALNKDAEKIAEAIEETKTDEEKKTVEEMVTEHETQLSEVKGKIKTLEDKIKALEDEKKDVEDKEPKTKEPNPNEAPKDERSFFNTQITTRGMGDNSLKVNKFETREQMRARLREEDVRSFYEDLIAIYRDGTTLANSDLLIPEQVMLSIQHRVGDYGVLIKEVNAIKLNGTGRVVLNSGTPTLFWTEMCDSLQKTTVGELNKVELDGYKLGGYLFLCNAMIEDSMIDLANYVEEEFAKAIAKFKDEAIMNGKGSTEKQPEGVRTIVKETSKVKNILGILQAIGSLGYGKDGEVLPYVAEKTIAVMNRNTYYSKVLPETYGKDSNGKIVYGLGQTLPDGTAIRISETVPTGEVVVGDFKNGYTWADRKATTFDTNDRLKWVEEQTGFKVSGRHDGKVIHSGFFKRVVFDETETPEV